MLLYHHMHVKHKSARHWKLVLVMANCQLSYANADPDAH